MDTIGRILGRGWAIFRSWPLWVQIIVGLIVLGVVTAPFASEPEDSASRDSVAEQPAGTADGEAEETEEPPEAEESQVDSRCVPVAKQLVRQIESGLTTDGKGRLRNEAFAVKSNDYEKVWMVAAEIDAPSLQGVGDVGVWGTNEDPSKKTSSGLIIRANGMAAEFSDWGAAAQDGSAADLNATDDGVAEAEACVIEALES
ncbi:MAG: hypothetical protein ACR2KQ_05570 [Actinomycetota bacterium]|jgi:hypothetical protein